ncbi:hypothetical protein FRC03_000587 [Tulasnella sp. 419]|nr:hypothetical protein FRC03_000587 [Tulasnella sp. 419]
MTPENVEPQSLHDGAPEHSRSVNRAPVTSIPLSRSPNFYRHESKDAPSALRTIWVVFALPVISCGYLIFCFVVDQKAVEVSTWNTKSSVSQLNIIKAGVTSLNIVVITVALLPLKTLLGDLQGEEFFRILTIRRGGVPLATVNQVSTCAYGFIDSISAIFRRQSSIVFVGAFVSGLIAVIASTLAPATLSVQIIQVDEDLRALRLGAIYRHSIWNSTEEGVLTYRKITDRAKFASGVPWVENHLKVNYHWGTPDDTVDGFIYAVPTPLDLPVHAAARYLTDIIKFKPSCGWYKPGSIKRGNDSIDQELGIVYGSIPELGWQIMMSIANTHVESVFHLYGLQMDLATSPVKDANGNIVADGTSLWHISKCVPGAGKCPSESHFPWDSVGNLVMNDIPTAPYTNSDGLTFAFSFLVCTPNLTVETREIRTSPEGRLEIVQSSTVLTRQNNIHQQQAQVLMSQALNGLAEGIHYSGPNPHEWAGMSYLGGAAHLRLLFDDEVASKTPGDLQFVVQPIQNITKSYGRILQSTLKLFLDGTLGEAHVPGRTIKEVLIFTTSRPHLYVSAVIFGILTVFVVAVHFRSPVPQFNFFSVASSLSHSEVPGVFYDIQYRDGGHISQQSALLKLGDRDVTLEGNPGVSPTVIRI